MPSVLSYLTPLVFGLVVSAAPTVKRDQSNVTDVDILNYALTLEHLENSFYSGALAQFDATAFEDAGYAPWVRERFQQIAAHEASHVQILQGALGDKATVPCNYTFPYTDVNSFAGLSRVIENVGVSAYLGAASQISSKAYLTVAGSILTTEARHQAWVASAVLKQNAWSGGYDTPLSLSGVYSIAAGFITACPSNAATLPVMAFPTLTLANSTPGATTTVSYDGDADNQDDKWLVVYSGLMQTAVQVVNGTAILPSGLQGISYAVLATTSNTTEINDSNTLAGPAIIDIPFNAAANNTA